MPDAGMLRGEALAEEAGGATLIQSFPAADLPADPAQRFGVLFAARPRWQLAELQPYLAGLRVRPLRAGCPPPAVRAWTSTAECAARCLPSCQAHRLPGTSSCTTSATWGLHRNRLPRGACTATGCHVGPAPQPAATWGLHRNRLPRGACTATGCHVGPAPQPAATWGLHRNRLLRPGVKSPNPGADVRCECRQVPGRSTEALLLLYARTSQEDRDAPVFYSAR